MFRILIYILIKYSVLTGVWVCELMMLSQRVKECSTQISPAHFQWNGPVTLSMEKKTVKKVWLKVPQVYRCLPRVSFLASKSSSLPGSVTLQDPRFGSRGTQAIPTPSKYFWWQTWGVYREFGGAWCVEVEEVRVSEWHVWGYWVKAPGTLTQSPESASLSPIWFRSVVANPDKW